MVMVEQSVVQHYTHGALEDTILNGLKALGRAPDEVRLEDLYAIDEFHMGGHQATVDLAAQLDVQTASSVLDVGCGLGGAARFLASRYGCRVVGVDITPEYVTVARALTRLVGLADRVDFQVASGLGLSHGAASFDLATLIHVGMNVPDKRALFAEVHRVLKPGGTFAVYDVMRIGAEELDYPVAWAATPATSFAEEPEAYRRALEETGFAVERERSRGDFALGFFRRMKARLAESGPPPLGLHILMGADAPVKVANMISNLENGRLTPIEMICRSR